MLFRLVKGINTGKKEKLIIDMISYLENPKELQKDC